MTRVPRIRLRTIFLLFLCAAVGLATYPDPLAALSPTIATAMVIGLIQQARVLVSCRTDQIRACKPLIFARQFAIAWRIVLATAMGFCLFLGMLLSRRLIKLPERDAILLIEPLTEGILSFGAIIVLCNSLCRWRSTSDEGSPRASRIALFSGIAATIAIIMLVEGTTVEFLVHRAVANIEAAQRYRRAGVYPNLGDEGYRSIWIALGAVICLLAAGGIIICWRRRAKSGPISMSAYMLRLLAFLIPPSIFCYWYYAREFHRLSPEMAGVGLSLIWVDWLAGASIAIILVTAGAYRLTKIDSLVATVSVDFARDTERDAFHESFPCLLLLGGNAIYTLGASFAAMFLSDSLFRTPTVGSYISMFCYPTTLLMLATCVASFQLCWVRWKRRLQKLPWQINGLAPLAFFQGWVVLAFILMVGIPTLRAFAFLLWLGPFDLLRLFGL